MRSGTRTASSGLCPRISSQTQSGTLRRWAPSTRKTSGVPPSTTIPSSNTGGTLFRAGPCTSTARDAGISGSCTRRPPSRRNTSGLPGARTTIPSRRAGRGGPSEKEARVSGEAGRRPRARSRTRSRFVNLAPAGARCPGRRRGRHRRCAGSAAPGRPPPLRSGRRRPWRGCCRRRGTHLHPVAPGPRGGEDQVEDGHLPQPPAGDGGHALVDVALQAGEGNAVHGPRIAAGSSQPEGSTAARRQRWAGWPGCACPTTAPPAGPPFS